MHPEMANLQFHVSNIVIKRNLGEITHEQSLIQPKPAGNCINFILGHIVATRCNFIKMLGGESVWKDDDIKKYDRHAAPLTDPAEAKPLNEIWQALDQTQQRIAAAVSKLDNEKLKQKAPFSPTNNPDETYGSILAVFAFHDAYHAGQTGVLRRIIGLPPADL
jgi:uncharacterized damage-inducible protein DinB